MTPARRVGIVPHPERSAALDLARLAAERLVREGLEVRVPGPESDDGRLAEWVCEAGAFAAGLDVVLSFGGDGTMLRAVDLAYGAGVPVLGVNVGQMGYLAEVEPADLDRALDRIVTGDYSVADRMVVAVEVESAGDAAGRWYALNETVLEKVHSGRLGARLGVEINDAPFTTYYADGVIVATPTGSTAYSFSARGPIVSPRLRCLVLTPVSPHMLFDRALVLAPEETIRFTVLDDRSVLLIADGREVGELAKGDVVMCTAGVQPARIVTFGPRDFHQILRAKFALPDR